MKDMLLFGDGTWPQVTADLVRLLLLPAGSVVIGLLAREIFAGWHRISVVLSLTGLGIVAGCGTAAAASQLGAGWRWQEAALLAGLALTGAGLIRLRFERAARVVTPGARRVANHTR